MALNLSRANAQVALLKRQSAAASHTARLLSAYKAELSRAWSGVEVDCLIKSIDAQIRACEKLSGESDALCRDMVRAMEEILREETAGGGETRFD